MQTMQNQSLENWVLEHAVAGEKKLYFTINGDVPLTSNTGDGVVYEIPVRGKRVCVLHPEHLSRVAQICHNSGVQMIQVLL
jgi:hypothetical protein